MPKQLKTAWYILIVSLVTIIAMVISAIFVGIGKAWPAMALFAFVSLEPFLFRKKAEPGEVEFDERDTSISRKAAIAGGMFSYLFFVLACMGVWEYFHYQGKETMPIHYLPQIVGIGGMILFFARALTTVILYGKRVSDDR
jgi:hypothetical protein